jgi:DNA-binding transcriptional MerR regulator
MAANDTLRIQEFARLAGVTVRSLHVYDEIGLLQPAFRTASGHRRYRRGDLLRLQQILTLKYLGFSLEEIRTLLNAPAYDLQVALRQQKAALSERISQLQEAVYAISRTQAAIEQARELDWTQVILTIQALQTGGKQEWLQRYFPPAQWAWLQERARLLPPELAEQGAGAWQELYAAFRAHQHLPPEDPAVQQLAARMHELGALFTGGDPAIEAGLAEMYRDVSQIPATYRADSDQALQDFMQHALAIYREQQGEP